MSQKVAIGGFDDDWQSWLAIVSLLATLGIVPKDWKPVIGAVGTIAAVYKIAKRLGWI
jgi:hypothetical protein